MSVGLADSPKVGACGPKVGVRGPIVVAFRTAATAGCAVAKICGMGTKGKGWTAVSRQVMWPWWGVAEDVNGPG